MACRVPENCAYTPLVHPAALSQPSQITITESSPRTYGLLNSGLVILHPSDELFNGIKHFLASSPLVSTFSFPDQDLLAVFFKGKWQPLPWCYNALKTLRIIHKPLWRDEEIRCLHYILHDKPWSRPPGTGGDYEEVNQWWWDRLDLVLLELKERDPEGHDMVVSNVAPR